MAFNLDRVIKDHNINPNTKGVVKSTFDVDTGHFTIRRKFNDENVVICTAPADYCIKMLHKIEKLANTIK